MTNRKFGYLLAVLALLHFLGSICVHICIDSVPMSVISPRLFVIEFLGRVFPALEFTKPFFWITLAWLSASSIWLIVKEAGILVYIIPEAIQCVLSILFLGWVMVFPADPGVSRIDALLHLPIFLALSIAPLAVAMRLHCRAHSNG